MSKLRTYFRACKSKFTKLRMRMCKVIAVCKAVFRFTRSCFVPKIFVIASQNRRNFRPNVLGPEFFRSGRKFLTKFYQLSHQRNVTKFAWWRSRERPQRLSGEKTRRKIETAAAERIVGAASDSCQAAIMRPFWYSEESLPTCIVE